MRGWFRAAIARRFALEQKASLSVVRVFTQDQLDGDSTTETGVAGAIDLAHATRAEAVYDLVRA